MGQANVPGVGQYNPTDLYSWNKPAFTIPRGKTDLDNKQMTIPGPSDYNVKKMNRNASFATIDKAEII